MAAAPAPAPAREIPWPDRLAQLHAYVTDHAGRFPPSHSPDPAVAELGLWYAGVSVHSPDDPEQAAQLEQLREQAERIRLHERDVTNQETFRVRLAQAHAYVRAHDGRFPTNRDPDPDTAALGCWWVAQNISINQARMAEQQRNQLAYLRELARQLRAKARERRAASNRAAAAERGRAATIAAGRRAAEAARAALDNPHLIPGDEQVLRLRIEHPQKSLAELAELAGMSRGQFQTKFYGALHRTANSRSPLPKSLEHRQLAPYQAAAELGVRPVVLARWTDAGLAVAGSNRQGHRRYTGAEVIRLKRLMEGGIPPHFVAVGEGRR